MLLPCKFGGRNMSGILFSFFASCESLTLWFYGKQNTKKGCIFKFVTKKLRKKRRKHKQTHRPTGRQIDRQTFSMIQCSHRHRMIDSWRAVRPPAVNHSLTETKYNALMPIMECIDFGMCSNMVHYMGRLSNLLDFIQKHHEAPKKFCRPERILAESSYCCSKSFRSIIFFSSNCFGAHCRKKKIICVCGGGCVCVCGF